MPHSSWLMDGQEEAKDNLKVPEVDEWTLDVVMFGSEDWKEDGFGLAEVTGTAVEEASIDARGLDIAGRLAASDLVDGPSGQVSEDVDVANPGGTTGADMEDEREFDPNWLWLLLAQVGYEVW